MAGKDSKVVIHVSCEHLKDKDLRSKSDPCCVMYVRSDDEWTEFGRTEVIMNSLNPRFTRGFELKFRPMEIVKFCVYDIDNKTPQLTDDDFLGGAQCAMADIAASDSLTLPLFLKAGKKAGKSTITLTAEFTSGIDEMLVLNFKAEKLANMDFGGKSDPFLTFSRLVSPDNWQPVCQTEVVKNNLNPVWRPLEVSVNRLCGGNHMADIKVDCYDYDDNGKHDLIGEFMTSMEELMQAARGKELRWECFNPKKKESKKKKSLGTIILASCMIRK